MATTTTMTLPPPTTTTFLSTASKPCCPSCGLPLPLPPPSSDSHAALLQAQRQIEDLQSQVRLLNQKATAAVDRWADYEDELSRLRAASTSTNSTTATSTKNPNPNPNSNNGITNRPHTPDPSVSTSSPRSSFLGAGAASRISQLLTPRKSAAAAAAAAAATSGGAQQAQRGSLSSVSSPALPLGSRDRTNSSSGEATGTTRELIAALTQERKLRAAAEEKLAAMSRDAEELSATLFEEANTMVATERRARAALEERVSELGQRDQEKKARLGRLEGAVERLGRVRGVLEDRDEGGPARGEKGRSRGDSAATGMSAKEEG